MEGRLGSLPTFSLSLFLKASQTTSAGRQRWGQFTGNRNMTEKADFQPRQHSPLKSSSQDRGSQTRERRLLPNQPRAPARPRQPEPRSLPAGNDAAASRAPLRAQAPRWEGDSSPCRGPGNKTLRLGPQRWLRSLPMASRTEASAKQVPQGATTGDDTWRSKKACPAHTTGALAKGTAVVSGRELRVCDPGAVKAGTPSGSAAPPRVLSVLDSAGLRASLLA